MRIFIATLPGNKSLCSKSDLYEGGIPVPPLDFNWITKTGRLKAQETRGGRLERGLIKRLLLPLN
mgnify:CR=1 FL=1